jgi:L-ascorbate oxidase
MKYAAYFVAFISFLVFSSPSWSDDFRVLDTFQSDSVTHALNLELVAEPHAVSFAIPDDTATNLNIHRTTFTTTTNVYKACKLGAVKSCSKNYYGGPRLILDQGDTLNLTFRNRMANFTEYGGRDPKAQPHDVVNCTNNHTHGLMVRANAPDDRLASDPVDTYGDNVFVTAKPEGATACGTMHHNKATSEINYQIKIPGTPGVSAMAPGDHPSGIYWFHPHVHTLAKEQVSGGLTGMINVGRLSDYACLSPSPDSLCSNAQPPLRHMLLKDIQLENLNPAAHSATVLFDQDAGFCEGHEGDALKGHCNHSDATGTTGKWLFTINGSVYPELVIPPAESRVWRIQNASANVTYDLRFEGEGWPASRDGGMPFQVLSLDGVGLGPSTNGPTALVRRAILMPGSRMEILLSHRAAATCGANPTLGNCPASTPAGNTTLELVTAGYDTGGDTWPRIPLASVTFNGRKHAMPPPAAMALATIPPPANFPLLTFDRLTPGVPFHNIRTRQACRSGFARALKPGEHRRIYFAIIVDPDKSDKLTDPNWRPETFVLGNSIITSGGKEINEDGTAIDRDGPVLRPMGHATAADLCIPYLRQTETWELVNVSREVHNFHIHQNKFTQVPYPTGEAFRTHSPIDAVNLPAMLLTKQGNTPVQHDSIIVPRGDAASCGDELGVNFVKLAEGEFRLAPTSTCRDSATGGIMLSIPFNRPESIGKYAYHCHILEHEDLGMMATIRVLSPAELNAPAAQ